MDSVTTTALNSSNDGIQTRKKGNHNHTGVHINTKQCFQYDAPCKERECNMNHHRRNDGDKSQPVSASPVVSFFQKIRQGGHFGPDVKWNKKQGKQDECKGSHPLKITREQTIVKSLTGQGLPDEGKKCWWQTKPVQSWAISKIVLQGNSRLRHYRQQLFFSSTQSRVLIATMQKK